ncbi:MAG: ATP-binding cassette domain-containing protein [Clostridia bacterium]|nr:ATP-binding cassette domain-containing protein [Clostridia bacterium]
MIDIKNLTFNYTGSAEAALKNIDLNISEGEFVGIIGPTGAGKSTLTLCLNGVVPHFQNGDYYGHVIIDGRDTVDNTCAVLAYSIGSVFQDPEAQIVSSIVEEEIAFGLENMGIPKPEMENRIEESLRLAGISHLRHSSTVRLSGGQKQRVAIAAAIALRPKVLVLDEPTSELDPLGSLDVFETLKKLNTEFNITVVVVEQKMQLVSEYCSRLVVMNKGSIIIDGPTRNVLSRQDILQELGVSCAPVTRLVSMLKNEGLYNGEIPVDVAEAFMAISKVLKNLS